MKIYGGLIVVNILILLSFVSSKSLGADNSLVGQKPSSLPANPTIALSKKSAASPRVNPLSLPKLSAVCLDGSSGFRMVSSAELKSKLKTALKAYDWRAKRQVAPDWNSQLQLELACGPDLDSDGHKDFLLRLTWQSSSEAKSAKDSNGLNSAPGFYHEAILVLRKSLGEKAGAFEVLDLLAYSAGVSSQSLARTNTDFVALPDGRAAVRCKTQTNDSQSGCKVLGIWVSTVEQGRIIKVGEADPEFCLPD